MPEQRINGVKLFYESTGSGDPLVLVHGSWTDHESWHFSSPALLTECDQSPPWFPQIMSKLAGAIDGAERLTFSGAGHAPQLTHPDAYVRAVGEFIRGRQARRSAQRRYAR